jgi:adhesin transport system membrane fusion protein
MKRRDTLLITNIRAVILEQSPRGGRLLIWGTIIFLILAYVWTDWAEIDEITRGSGKVIPSQQLQVIQNLEGGIVSELLVSEGELVKQGQPLVKIDDIRFSSSFEQSRLKHLSLQAQAGRLEAETSEQPFRPQMGSPKEYSKVIQRELELYHSRQQQLYTSLEILQQQRNQRKLELSELHAKKDKLSRSHSLAKQELDLTSPLVADGAVSEVDILRLRRTVNDLHGELRTVRLSIPRAESRLQEAERKIEETKLEFINQARSELNQVRAELEQINASNQALEDRVKRTLVRSPVNGHINRLLINTVGGVIQPGMDILEIVPLDDTLLVEAKIRPKDIGFLHPGQEALVKFTAYDFAIYGGLDAQLEYISADSITDENGEPFFLVRVRTDKNFLEGRGTPLAIIPGMLSDVDIKTGKKTVLQYILKPVLRAKEYALKER